MSSFLSHRLSDLPGAGNETYMKLKLEGFRKSAVPTRMAKRLDDVVHMKPVANHRYNVSAQTPGHRPRSLVIAVLSLACCPIMSASFVGS